MATGLRTAQVGLAALVAATLTACNTGTGDDAESTSLAISALDASQQAKLTAADGAEFDQLGIAVAVSGDTALVAADRDDDRGSDAGAVYVFVRNGASWAQQAKLTAADGAANEGFGASVALWGDTAVIGAISDADPGGSALGAAYVFVRSGTSWIQQAKLTAIDGSANDQFGGAVAVSGDTAVIGAVNDSDAGSESGSAYVFVRSGTTWTQQAKLTAADGAAGDHFGTAVAASGDTALIGASRDDDAGGESGSAYVFVRSGALWSLETKLTATDAAADDHFGAAVAVSGDTALIGALFDDDGGSNAGSAYVFVRSGAAWSQQAKLTAADGSDGDNLGGAVALSGDTAVVGAILDGDLGAASGSAYVFERSGGGWSQAAKLTAADGAAVDLFGVSVGVSNDTFVIGAFGDDDHGSSSGAAYVFAPPPTGSGNGTACTAGAQCASGFCTDGVCCDTACGGGDPSDCQACSVAAGAVADGTCAPRAAGIVCRSAAGGCDVAEQCTGSSTACPANSFAGTATTCRAAAGACDVAEHCTGSSAACPSDVLANGGTVCRPAVNSCDLRETCTASSAACPGDAHKPDLSLCSGLLGLPGVCLLGHCVL